MIPIYKYEHNLSGLDNNKVVAHCQLSKTKISKKEEKILLEAIASEYDKDLYPVSTILVSSGWNGNDDVFDVAELRKSKYTPEDKPLNKEHKSREIVGHITRSEFVDDKLNIIYDEDDVDECHILAEGVIYRHIGTRDEELKEETEGFIEELENGEWFVSMETLFNDFDYAVEHPTLGKMIVKRNDDNSHLTQYLRAYGGTGQFKEYKIGRLLRNLTFSAEGFVKNPANPKSLVLNNRQFTKAEVVDSFAAASSVTLDNGGHVMADINFEAKYNDALAEIKELRDKLAKTSEQTYAKQIEDNEKVIAELNAKLTEKDGVIDNLTEEGKNAAKEITSLKANLEDANKKLTEAQDKLEKSAAEQLRTNRISIMVDAGIDKAEAEEFVDKFISVNDEQFNSIVELRKSTASTEEDKEEASLDEDVEGEKSVKDTEVDDKTVDQTTLAADSVNTVKSDLEKYFSTVALKIKK